MYTHVGWARQACGHVIHVWVQQAGTREARADEQAKQAHAKRGLIRRLVRSERSERVSGGTQRTQCGEGQGEHSTECV